MTFDEEYDGSVEDLEALRRAEEAVSHGEPAREGPQAPIDEDWAVVARQTGVIVVGLDEVARSLEAGDVPIGWDPYDPRDSVAFLPPGIGTGPRTYALVVPGSQLGRARRILDGVAPQGVTYAWDAQAGAEPTGADRGFGDGSEFSAPTTPAPRRTDFSDNERLKRLAGGGSGGAAGFAVALGIVAIIVVVLLAIRG